MARRDSRWLRAVWPGVLVAGTAALELHNGRRAILLAAGDVRVTAGTAVVNVEQPPLAKSVYGWLARAGPSLELYAAPNR